MPEISFEELKDLHHEVLNFRSKTRAAIITLRHLDIHLIKVEKRLRALTFETNQPQEVSHDRISSE